MEDRTVSHRWTFLLLAVCTAWIVPSAAMGQSISPAPGAQAESGPQASPGGSTARPVAEPFAKGCLFAEQREDAAHKSMEVEVASLVTELNFPGLWQKNSTTVWIVLTAFLAIGLLCGRTCGSVLIRLGKRFEARRWDVLARVVFDLVGPVRLAIFTAAITVGLAGVEMSDTLRLTAGKAVKLLYFLAVFWYVHNLIGLVDVAFRRLQFKEQSQLDKQLAPLVRKSLRCFLIVLGVLFVVDSVFDQDIRAWLAGLGIVGLAVSLAAQDSIKNFFGSVTILVDRPFQVGEQIVFGGYEGTIEEIGFRSTTVRTTNGHVVTVPNSTIVNNSVENISRRPYIRRAFNLSLPNDTPAEKLIEAVTLVRAVLAEPEIGPPLQTVIHGESFLPQVYFSELHDDQVQIAVCYCYSPPESGDYSAHAQRVNLQILTRFAQAGIKLNSPSAGS
jgi:MscS family membrane protein